MGRPHRRRARLRGPRRPATPRADAGGSGARSHRDHPRRRLSATRSARRSPEASRTAPGRRTPGSPPSTASGLSAASTTAPTSTSRRRRSRRAAGSSPDSSQRSTQGSCAGSSKSPDRTTPRRRGVLDERAACTQAPRAIRTRPPPQCARAPMRRRDPPATLWWEVELPTPTSTVGETRDPRERIGRLLRDERAHPGGLSTREAERRLVAFGPNLLQRRGGRTWPHQLVQQITHPLALLLWVAAALAFAAGMPPLGIAIVAVVVVQRGVSPSSRSAQAERAVEALAGVPPPSRSR